MGHRLPTTALAVTLGLGTGLGLGLGLASLAGAPAVAAYAQSGEPASTIASCNALTIIENMYVQEPYQSQRNELATSLREGISATEAQMGRIEAEFNLMTPSDPNRQMKANEYRTLQNQLQTQTEEAGRELQNFNANQLVEIYEIVIAKATEIAQDNGYTHLVMSRRGDQPFDVAVGVSGVIQDILARPVPLAPSTTDITMEVREALDVPEPDEDESTDSVIDPAADAVDGTQPDAPEPDTGG